MPSDDIDTDCSSCGETDWVDDSRFGSIRCGNCGYRPKRARRDDLEEALS